MDWLRLLAARNESRNVAWIVLERVLRLAVGLSVGILVARHLGASDYGRLAYVIAIASFLTPFITAGEGFVVRDIAAGDVSSGAVLASATVLASALTAVVTVALLVSDEISPGTFASGTHTLLLVVVIGTAVRPLGGVDFWFQAHLRAARATAARLAAFVAATVARVTAVAMAAPVAVFAWIFAGEAVAATLLLLASYRLAGESFGGWRLHWSYLKALSRRAFPLLGSSIAIVLYLRIDQVMLGSISGVRQSGLYAVAVTMSEVAWFLPLAVGTVFTPGMTRLWRESQDRYAERLQDLFVVACFAAYVVAAASAAVGVWFIPLAYGHAYSDVAPTFLVLALANPFVFLGVIETIWTVNADRQGIAFARTALAAVANIALNLVLLKPLGATGAAITTVVAYALAAVALNALFSASRPIVRMQLRALALRDLRRALRVNREFSG
ncbi:MAG TPA: flippase [Mycobacteriales bacterium]|nr:flippase [Mycobacteriales bacterium]